MPEVKLIRTWLAVLGLGAVMTMLGACTPTEPTPAEPKATEETASAAPKAEEAPKVAEETDTKVVPVMPEAGETVNAETKPAEGTEAELGVKIYPGATMVKGSASRSTLPMGTRVRVQYDTTAGIKEIIDFYRKELKDFSEMSGENGAFVGGKNSRGEIVSITLNRGEGKAKTNIEYMLSLEP